MSDEKQPEKKIDEIKRKCTEAGLSVAEVFREAKEPYSTVQNWERGDPKPFKTYNNIIATINKMAADKVAEPAAS
jgi:DNA-binding transcriptional regulator YiaG